MKNKDFQYGGYHFVPERWFSEKDRDFFAISRRLRIDCDLGFCKLGYAYESKFSYSHQAFYAAAGNTDSDLFRCVENGKLYLPCENDLQRYMENMRGPECRDCGAYDSVDGCALTNRERMEYCPHYGELDDPHGDYKSFYE